MVSFSLPILLAVVLPYSAQATLATVTAVASAESGGAERAGNESHRIDELEERTGDIRALVKEQMLLGLGRDAEQLKRRLTVWDDSDEDSDSGRHHRRLAEMIEDHLGLSERHSELVALLERSGEELADIRRIVRAAADGEITILEPEGRAPAPPRHIDALAALIEIAESEQEAEQSLADAIGITLEELRVWLERLRR